VAFEHRPLEDRDREVVSALSDSGDMLGCLRNVQHHARFETRGEAESFSAELAPMGYHFEVRENGIHRSGQNEWKVEFAMIQAVDISSVQRHTKRLQEAAARHNGEYLGWVTQPVRRLPGV